MGLVLVLDRKGERQLNIPGCRDIHCLNPPPPVQSPPLCGKVVGTPGVVPVQAVAWRTNHPQTENDGSKNGCSTRGWCFDRGGVPGCRHMQCLDPPQSSIFHFHPGAWTGLILDRKRANTYLAPGTYVDWTTLTEKNERTEKACQIKRNKETKRPPDDS